MNDLKEKLGLRFLEKEDSLNNLYPLEQNVMFALPAMLKDLFLEENRPIVFDKGAKFTPQIKTGREDGNGYLSLDSLYSLSVSGDNSLGVVNLTFASEIRPDLIIIGESSGGDQICFDKLSHEIYLWMHDIDYESSDVMIAKNFRVFVDALEPDEADVNASREVIENESFLDF